MSHPPPGLGGGVARTGPPPGFGTSNSSGGNPPNSAGGIGGGTRNNNGAASIVKAQIVFLLTTLTDETFEKASKDLRDLASNNGPEMYYHLLNRICMVANPYIQGMIQHFHQYKEDPAAPPHNLPTHGGPAVAWRLLVSEAARASRDVSLAPQFANAVLSPMDSTCLPVPSLRIFGLPPQFLFALASYALAATDVFLPSHPSYSQVEDILFQACSGAVEAMYAPSNYWTYQLTPNHPPFSEDLSVQEARTLILATYPRSAHSDNPDSRPPSPTNPTAPHTSCLDTYRRGLLLEGLVRKFNSPAIILQTLTALYPGGPPGGKDTIPLHEVLMELGDVITSNQQTVEAIVDRWWTPWILDAEDRQLVDNEITTTLHGLLSGREKLRTVHLGVVIQVFMLIPGVSWPYVIKSFDSDNAVNKPDAIVMLIRIVLQAPPIPIPAISALLPATPDAPTWTHVAAQLAVMKGIIEEAPDDFPVFTMPNASHPSTFARIVDIPSSTSSLPQVAQNEARELQNAGVYNAMGFIVVIVKVFEMAESDTADGSLYDAANTASNLMTMALRVAPELVLLGLEKMGEPLPPRAHVNRERLWNSYLAGGQGDRSETLVLHELWSINSEQFLGRLAEFYAEDESRIARVVTIGMELSILDKLLSHDNTQLALDVAALGVEGEFLDLEMWLADGVEAKGNDFLQSIFDFVENKIRIEFAYRSLPKDIDTTYQPLSPAVYSIFIRVIRNAENLSAEDVPRFKHLRTDILILHPRLLNLYPGSKEEQGFSEYKPSKDMSSRVDEFYGAMYHEQTTADSCLQALKTLQTSTDPNDRELFRGCMHQLLDEIQFFNNYPPKEIAMTSVLFGGIIDARLIRDVPAFVATRYLLDACKTEPSKPMFSFGVYAISVMRGSLVDFPGLCRSLLDIPTLHELHQPLINDIVAALSERQELDQQGGVKLAFPALKLPILVEEGYDEFVEPEPKKKDAIMFIINQIAPSNYEQKSRDLMELFDDEYSRWFAHYFIEVRVSLEQNRHEIYMNIIELLNSPVLEKHILWETYRKTRDLINADATMSSSSQRASLKTIALWLGRITLARNKPIRMRELSVKDILIQGYDNKRLIVAIPFVCNLLASCKESVVFHLPNPWLSAMLGLLVEIYTFPEVRLNLKFEIEVLFTKLEVALNAVEPSTILRTRVPPSQPLGDAPDRLDTEYKRALAEMTTNSAANNAVAMRSYNDDGDREPPNNELAQWFVKRTDELLSRLPEAMTFPDFAFLQTSLARRAVHDAICLAIKDMITPVVERSVTIAGISTRDLLAKDFSTEADAGKLRHAAQLMVKNLAGNLAMVTCRDPLRERMISNVRMQLGMTGLPEHAMAEPVINTIVEDNIEVATAVLKSLTVDKASKDIDVNLSAHFAARRVHRDSRTTQPFIDSASVTIALPPASLPQMLRMIPGGLLPLQARVYEDFVEPTRGYAPNGDGPKYRDADHDRTGYQQELDSHSMRHSPLPRSMSIQDAIQSFQSIAARVDQYIDASAARSLAELPADHPLRNTILSVIHLISQVASNEQPAAALGIAQKVVQLLYRSVMNISREAYVTMLQSLCEFSPVVDREVKDWLIHADDARKLNVPVTITLIQVGMIAIPELDRRMSQMLMRKNIDAAEVDFVTDLVRELSTGESPMSPRNAFAYTLTAMLKQQESGSSTRGIDALLSELRRTKGSDNPRPPYRQTPVSDNDEPVVIDEKKQAQLKHFFLDWVRTYQTNADTESAFRPYIAYLHNEGILIGEDITTAFYKMAIHVAVDSFGQIGQDENASIGTDSLAKLMILIAKNQFVNRGTVPDLARSSYYFRKIITILSYCLIERHMELGEMFDQKPWARIFTSILSELYQLGDQFEPLRRGCLRVLAKVLGLTQPVYAPRFAFGWMSIVTHRSFMPQLLFDDVEGSWSDYHKCLMWLLRFAEPVLKLGEMTHSSRSMYKGICRLFCVLVHDFPEFLDEYYHSFCTAIPPNCVQLRNIALSAFPIRDGPLPDPHRGLDRLLPEMQRYPIVRADYAEALEAGGIKAAIDQHVATGRPEIGKIVAELRNRIAVKTMSADGPVITWNRTLLHAAVYYLGTTCIARIGEQTGIVEFNPQSPEVAILAELALNLDGEGQYYLLSVVADQLRYPSAHTYFYISFMLYLFVVTSRTEQPNSIPDRIGRVLLERIIVQRPHPFGLLVCFVELMEDQKYGFWRQPFAQAPGELHEIFLRVQKNIVRARDDDMDRRAQKQLNAMNEGEEIEYRNSP